MCDPTIDGKCVAKKELSNVITLHFVGSNISKTDKVGGVFFSYFLDKIIR